MHICHPLCVSHCLFFLYLSLIPLVYHSLFVPISYPPLGISLSLPCVHTSLFWYISIIPSVYLSLSFFVPISQHLHVYLSSLCTYLSSPLCISLFVPFCHPLYVSLSLLFVHIYHPLCVSLSLCTYLSVPQCISYISSLGGYISLSPSMSLSLFLCISLWVPLNLPISLTLSHSFLLLHLVAKQIFALLGVEKNELPWNRTDRSPNRLESFKRAEF